jgi:hypothetical protein
MLEDFILDRKMKGNSIQEKECGVRDKNTEEGRESC